MARALRLDSAGLRHAMRLAGYHEPVPADADRSTAGRLAAAVRPVLDSWPASPAALLDRHFDLLAWNAAWTALWGSPEHVPADRRNLMWLLAVDHRLREVLPDWEPLAMNVFQHFRAQAGPALADPRTGELYRLLEHDAPELNHWWGCHSVAELTARTVRATPPGLAPVRLTLSSFHPVDDPSALVVLFTPATPADAARMTELTAAGAGAGRTPGSAAGPQPASAVRSGDAASPNASRRSPSSTTNGRSAM
ncbi:hypothetical protein ACFQ2M_32540 [Kitasatospora saccharophila]|uniref:MmyB family transcriptional regulator n=1 Tax=Kitasatospora saccharophila TaxID=407973 RepID=UPI00363D94D3